ncbi:putative reverse transcriptase domain-containing protein [Tanacetum coccineum]
MDDSHSSGAGARRNNRNCAGVQPIRLHEMSTISSGNCTVENQVKFATCTLMGTALTWWNSHARTVTNDVAYAMTWSDLKKEMTTKYCPRNEIKKIETELWNLKVQGTDVVAYNQRFQELALLSDRMFPEEADKIERYVGGMPDPIYSSVVASKPKTMQEAIEMATGLMERRINTLAERQTENKRRLEDTPRNNQNQQPNKRQNTGRAYAAGNGDRKPYEGAKPRCPKCNFNHYGPCTPKCTNCRKLGHLAKDCRNRPATANNNNRNTNNNNNRNNNNPRAQGANTNAIVCFECGAPGHFRNNCPQWRNKNQGNGSGVARAYAIGVARAKPETTTCDEEATSRGADRQKFSPEVLPEELGSQAFHLPDKLELHIDLGSRRRQLRRLPTELDMDITNTKSWPFWFDQRTPAVCYRPHEPSGQNRLSGQIPVFQRLPNQSKLTSKEGQFDGVINKRQAFQLIEAKLCSAPILALNPKECRIYRILRASKEGLGRLYDAKRKEAMRTEKLEPRTDGTLCLNGRMLDRAKVKPNSRDNRFVVQPEIPPQCEVGQYHEDFLSKSFSRSSHGKTPICVGEVQLTRSKNSTRDRTERIIQVKQRMQAARDRQKSYADLKRKPMEFEVGDKVMLKVSPWKGLRVYAPTKPYRAVPLEMDFILMTSFISREPIEITDREVKRLKRSRIPLVKVRWNSKRGPEFTWEREDQFKKKYPHLFTKTAQTSSACCG